MEFSPKPLSSLAEAEEIAHTFGGLCREVIRRTVADDVLRVKTFTRSGEWADRQWVVSCLDDQGEPLPFKLNGGGGWLLAQQRLGVRKSRADGQLWLTTLRYRYRWQTGEDDGTWLVRWDYHRDRGGPHVHMNGDPRGWDAGNFHKLHLPTRRVAIEDVVRFLLTAKIGVKRRSDYWEETLDAATEIFERIQRRESFAD